MKATNKLIHLLFLLCFGFLALPDSVAQNGASTPPTHTQATRVGRTKALRDIVIPEIQNLHGNKIQEFKKNKPKVVPNFLNKNAESHPNAANAYPKNGDPALQNSQRRNPEDLVEPLVVVDGILQNQAGGVTPPDPSGDISPDHFIQSVNDGNGTKIKIIDKEGNTVLAPTNINFLWNELGLTGLGDPIVLWDQLAQRWLLTEFADFGSNAMLCAISQTSDPLGEWNVYEFSTASFPDYPKWAVWPNAYVATTNEGGPIPIYAFDKAAMINGDPVVDIQIFYTDPYGGEPFAVSSPVDWNGSTMPPPGSPILLSRMYDDSYGPGVDHLDFWELFVDWDNANNSHIDGPISLNTMSFESEVCDGSFFDCVDQPNGTELDALEGVVMNRANYRNFGTHESIVLCHTVDASPNDQDICGVRWYEVRKTGGGPWTIYQQSTFSPDLNVHRWMGSINQDANGNMCLAYSVVGTNDKPSLRFTGRRASDPLNQMTVDEYEFATGNNYNTETRWGDYHSMSVDPSDDRTFWFTGEYQKNNNWGTSIVSVLMRRDSNDIGPVALLDPSDSPDLSNMESVTVQYKNFGYKMQSNFNVGFIFENEPAQIKNVASVLNPDATVDITFDLPVNMNAIQSYNFKLFTSLSNDENIQNDTLNVIVRKLPKFDAALNGFNGLDNPICLSGDPLTIGINVLNAGEEILTSFDIDWQINGGTVTTTNWTGNLAPDATTTVNVSVPAAALNAGINTISATTSSPNGMLDENTTNDTQSREFTVVLGGGQFILQIETDNYPEETSWEVKDLSGNVLYSGGTYPGQQQEIIEIPMCLDPEQCYILTLYDTYGDGIQASGIEGDVLIYNPEGTVVFNLAEPDYGNQQSYDFCGTFECLLAINTTSSPASDINNGVILISATNGTAPIQYSINNGVSFQNSGAFNNLPAGTYQCIVSDANSCTTAATVIVESCSIQRTFAVTNATSGQNNGSVTITATGGNPPYTYSKNGGASFSNNNTFNNLAAGEYVFCIKDADNCRVCETIVVEESVGVTTINQGTYMELSPNPTDGPIRLDVFGVQTSKIRLSAIIYDAAGKIVMHQQLAKFDDFFRGNFSLKSYPAGTYYIWVTDPEVNKMVTVVRL